MIKDFTSKLWNWDIVWCYYALHNRTDADWGLVYNNNTLQESGKTMKKLLARQDEEDFSDSNGLYLIASVVVGISALAIRAQVVPNVFMWCFRWVWLRLSSLCSGRVLPHP